MILIYLPRCIHFLLLLLNLVVVLLVLLRSLCPRRSFPPFARLPLSTLLLDHLGNFVVVGGDDEDDDFGAATTDTATLSST